MERLDDLWKTGDSASVIGKKLGISRSAVLGKVYRMGLASRADLHGPKTVFKKRSKPKARKSGAPYKNPKANSVPQGAAEGMPCPPSMNMVLFDMDLTQCRYPTNDAPKGGLHLFCGNAVWDLGKPYCAYHAAIVKKRD